MARARPRRNEALYVFEDAPNTARIEMAARDAILLEDITSMPMGLDTMVGAFGAAL